MEAFSVGEVTEELRIVGGHTYLRVNLDTITNNLSALKSRCSHSTEMIPVVKANAYGHGSVEVSRHLCKSGIKRLAVATLSEGVQLRQAGIDCHIQILGNAVEMQIPALVLHRLTPTVATSEYIQKWSTYCERSNDNQTSHEEESETATGTATGLTVSNKSAVIVKMDTGMSRNGCQPDDLDDLIMTCTECSIAVDSIMTHFAQAWTNSACTSKQLDTFMHCAEKYRCQGIKLHAANSAAILQGVGTDLDFVRPGISMYGLPPDNDKVAIANLQDLGIKPALSWVAKPNLVKTITEGRLVGYEATYRLSILCRCKGTETIGTFGVGYADGYRWDLSSGSIVRGIHGSSHPVVGRVSMDAITAKLDGNVPGVGSDIYFLITPDFDSPTSVCCIADRLKTISYEVCTGLAARLPRLYISSRAPPVLHDQLTSQS